MKLFTEIKFAALPEKCKKELYKNEMQGKNMAARSESCFNKEHRNPCTISYAMWKSLKEQELGSYVYVGRGQYAKDPISDELRKQCLVRS